MTRKILSILLAIAMMAVMTPVAIGEALPVDGVYTGIGAGMHSTIKVEVAVEGAKIASVTVLEQDETVGISDPALEQIPNAIVAANSTDVDVVTNATLTSEGIIEAVENALAGKEETREEVVIVPDVIVVGSGMAGLSATVRSVELGLNVLMLEESVRVGGCIHNAGGTISGAGFKIQVENGVEDTPESYYNDILKQGGEGEYNEELAYTHTKRAGEAIDWLDEDLGVDFGDRSLVGGAYTAMPTLRVTRARGSYSMGAANEYLEKLYGRVEEYIAEGKVQLLFNSKVTEILVENNECYGVKVGETEYLASSVVLATGGYAYNEELLKLAGFENVISQAPATSNGSGHIMALSLGGVLDNADEYLVYYGGGVPTNGFAMEYQIKSAYPGMVYVNTDGVRVVAEESAGIDAWKNTAENKLYAVISSNMIDNEQGFLAHGMANKHALSNNGWDKLEELAAAGNCVYKADTIEELADMIGAASLPETIAAYNADVAAGADSAFGRKAENLIAVEEGPFYAVLTVPYVWSGVSGGIRANGEGYLWLEDGSVVEGLSLAGEILGPSNILGKINFGGINHSMCATWGMIAAEKAVERAGK